MEIRGFLANSVYMMIVAFVVGFLFGYSTGGFGAINSQVAMFSLVVMMSFSLCNLRLRGLDIRNHSKTVLLVFLLSFVVSSGITILMAYMFDGAIRDGWILIAAVPSAVSVIPYTYILRGDVESSLVASAAVYLIALIVTPIITLFFLGTAVGPMTVLYYIGVLIIVPLAISRLLGLANISKQTRTIAINLGFFVLVLSVVGANWDVFFGTPWIVGALILVALVRTFGIGGAVELYSRRVKVDRTRRAPLVLFSTYKNAGMAAALGMTLVTAEAAIPAAVCMTIEVLWFIALKKYLYPDEESNFLADKESLSVQTER